MGRADGIQDIAALSVAAAGTPAHILRAVRRVGLEVVSDDSSQGIQEARPVVQCGCTPVMSNPYLMGYLSILSVQLGQRFYVVAGESNGDHQQILVTPRTETANHLLGARPQPPDRSYVGLVGQKVRVRPAQTLNHPLNARPHL